MKGCVLALASSGCLITGQLGLSGARDPRAQGELSGQFQSGFKTMVGDAQVSGGPAATAGITVDYRDGGESFNFLTGGAFARVDLRTRPLDTYFWEHRIWSVQLYGGGGSSRDSGSGYLTDFRLFVGIGKTSDDRGDVRNFQNTSVGVTIGRLGLEDGDSIWFLGVAGVLGRGWDPTTLGDPGQGR